MAKWQSIVALSASLACCSPTATTGGAADASSEAAAVDARSAEDRVAMARDLRVPAAVDILPEEFVSARVPVIRAECREDHSAWQAFDGDSSTTTQSSVPLRTIDLELGESVWVEALRSSRPIQQALKILRPTNGGWSEVPIDTAHSAMFVRPSITAQMIRFIRGNYREFCRNQ
jgi:hypothetical protein